MDSPRSRLSLLFALLLLLIFTAPFQCAASILEDTVVKIADGDTITVLDSNKVQHEVRIAGIDAPAEDPSLWPPSPGVYNPPDRRSHRTGGGPICRTKRTA